MNRKCFSNHMGLWLHEPVRFRQSVDAVLGGVDIGAAHDDLEGDPAERPPYAVTPGGVAIIGIEGTMMKAASKFGGTGTIGTRQALRAAVNDGSVRGILLHIDSPGGHASGTFELAGEVAATARTKPVRAHVDDLGASAAYWVMSQASRITVNHMGEIGSIGTMALLFDTSEAAKKDGVKVHVISTGEFKGVGAPGVEIPDEHLAYVRERVDAINGFFQRAVSAGRGLVGDDLAAVSDGRVFGAQDALALGLVDDVMSYEDAVQDFEASLAQAAGRNRAAQARASVARRRLDEMGA